MSAQIITEVTPKLLLGFGDESSWMMEFLVLAVLMSLLRNFLFYAFVDIDINFISRLGMLTTESNIKLSLHPIIKHKVRVNHFSPGVLK